MERPPIPAPFVYGGSFSEWKTEQRKITRFRTLKCLSRGRSSGSSEEDGQRESDDGSTVDTEEENHVETYADARAQGIGTLSEIDTGEGIVRIVDLAAIARYLQGLPDPDEEDEEDDDDGEEEELEEEEEDEEIVEGKADLLEGHKMECSATASRDNLPVPCPVVYSGTFEDYKSGAMKFKRFSTIASLGRSARRDDHRVRCGVPKEAVDNVSLAASRHTTTPTPSYFSLRASSPSGCFSCQLLALACPPSQQQGHTMYVELSQAVVWPVEQSALEIGTTKAAEVVQNARSTDIPVQDKGMLALNFVPAPPEVKSVASRMKPPCTGIKQSVKGPYRFRLDAGELHALKPSPLGSGLGTLASSKLQNVRYTTTKLSKDDGSSWIVPAGTSYRKNTGSSGASWGGTGSLLEPIYR